MIIPVALSNHFPAPVEISPINTCSAAARPPKTSTSAKTHVFALNIYFSSGVFNVYPSAASPLGTIETLFTLFAPL